MEEGAEARSGDGGAQSSDECRVLLQGRVEGLVDLEEVSLTCPCALIECSQLAFLNAVHYRSQTKIDGRDGISCGTDIRQVVLVVVVVVAMSKVVIGSIVVLGDRVDDDVGDSTCMGYLTPNSIKQLINSTAAEKVPLAQQELWRHLYHECAFLTCTR